MDAEDFKVPSGKKVSLKDYDSGLDSEVGSETGRKRRQKSS